MGSVNVLPFFDAGASSGIIYHRSPKHQEKQERRGEKKREALYSPVEIGSLNRMKGSINWRHKPLSTVTARSCSLASGLNLHRAGMVTAKTRPRMAWERALQPPKNHLRQTAGRLQTFFQWP